MEMKKSILYCLLISVVLSVVDVSASFNEDLEEVFVSDEELQESAEGTVVGRKTTSSQEDTTVIAAWADDVEEIFFDEDAAAVWNVVPNNPYESAEQNLVERVFSVKNINSNAALMPTVFMPSINFPDVNIKLNYRGSRNPVYYKTVYTGRTVYTRRLIHGGPRRIYFGRPPLPKYGPRRPLPPPRIGKPAPRPSKTFISVRKAPHKRPAIHRKGAPVRRKKR